MAGCTSEWRIEDVDGDGFTVADGDCWESAEGPAGSGLSGAEIFPGASDKWYDGVDQNCDSADDFDADGDGYVPDEFEGMTTEGVEGSGALPGGDCWDDPSSVPDDMSALNGLYDSGGAYAAAGYSAPEAVDVNPGQVEDLAYDGVDADCAGEDADGSGADDEFDVDGDGETTSFYTDRAGEVGGDCIDCGDDLTACLADDNPAGTDPASVNPDAEETWYDGTDQDCDTNDCDADGDTYDASGSDSDTEFCELVDCDDEDENRFPDGSAETYYDGVDNNCDLSDGDGDQDGDLYWADDYADQVNANPDKVDDPLEIPEGFEGDCDDSTDASVSADNGFDDLTPADINPGAEERYYDSIDQNCDEADDYDWDGDGYTTSFAVDGGGGLGSDCNDCDLACTTNACAEYALVCSNEPENPAAVFPEEIYPTAEETWYDGTDQDCLGTDFDGNGSEDDYDVDGDGYESELDGTGDDCDDFTDTTNPGVNEDCNTTADDDCDGNDNDDGATDCITYYADVDGDGQGDETDEVCYCTTEGDYTTTNDQDCDDDEATIYYGASELCDGQINNCAVSSLPDDESDLDSDGYVECTEDSGGWDGAAITGDEDCDDDDDTVYPSAADVCDGQDNDCDGNLESDENDDDSDGYVECTVDSDGWDGSSISGGDDCDDAESTVYPSATELCDGQYNDCDDSGYSSSGAPDDETDDDSDGYVECTLDSGGWDGSGSILGEDCNDDDATVSPGDTEICDGQDNDCDGTLPDDESDLDGDGYSECEWDSGGWDGDSSVVGEEDCDDDNEDRSPGLTEVCDDADLDEDCDGISDDDDSSVDTSTYDTWYYDGDGDAHVEASPSTVSQCEEPADPSGDAQYLLFADLSSFDDCDDADSAISPDADEICDASNVDEDCDGYTDDSDSNVDTGTYITYYEDSDGDGEGTTLSTVSQCDQPSGYTTDDSDCDDSDAAINTSATEVCDSSDTDEDCNGVADDDDSGVDSGTFDTWYLDGDDDGYIASGASTTDACDSPGSSYIASASVPADADCDDGDTNVNPGAQEVCDASDTDEDCDGLSDDDDSSVTGQTTYYLDDDSDGYGDSSASADYCDPPSNYVDDDEDCDDTETSINPGEDEVCEDDIDNDCNTVTVCAFEAELADANAVFEGVNGELGRAVLLLDSDGDGNDDIMLGGDSNGSSNKGEVYAIFGPTSATAMTIDGGSYTQDVRDLSSIADYDHLISGAGSNSDFGSHLANAGDHDGDGAEDLLVSAYVGDENATNAGDVYLFFGPVSTITSASYSYQIKGVAAAGYNGTSIVGDFDFDGGGLDILMGAPGDDPAPSNGTTGEAYLFSGPLSSASQTQMDTDDADVTFTGSAADDLFGFSAAAGDVDADGNDDVYIGSPYAADNGSSSGMTYLYLGQGSPGSTLAVGDADATYEGAAAGDRAGWSVTVGDLNNDGYDDLVAGADADDDGGGGSGSAFVFYGAASPSGSTSASAADAQVVGAEASDRAGFTVAIGNIDGDSTNDLLVGAIKQDNNSVNTGGVGMFLGPVSGTLNMGTADALSVGETLNDNAGYSLSTGDVDNDGLDDVLVGANSAGNGTAYLLLGTWE